MVLDVVLAIVHTCSALGSHAAHGWFGVVDLDYRMGQANVPTIYPSDSWVTCARAKTKWRVSQISCMSIIRESRSLVSPARHSHSSETCCKAQTRILCLHWAEWPITNSVWRYQEIFRGSLWGTIRSYGAIIAGRGSVMWCIESH